MYLFSLAASDHRSSGTTATVPVVPVKSAQDPSLLVNLEAIVCKGLEHGLDNVINSKLRNNPASHLGKEVVLLARTLQEKLRSGKVSLQVLQERFVDIIKLAGVPVYECERELLLSQFFQLRIDRQLRSLILAKIISTPTKAALGFYQNFLREAMACIIAGLAASLSAAVQPDETSEMSQAEQNVLFYISGYMARKVAALPQAPADLKDACVSNGKDNLGFVEKFTEWTRTINRGGLRIPSQALFLLVRSMDRVHSSRIDLTHMTSDSLNLVIMTDAVMEDINVKYHWEAVLSNSKVEEPSVFRILEYLTKLFLTVKGFAVARHLRSRLRTEGYSAKKNLSLRHELRN